ncbi:MAG TPA: hypothetical protein VIU35_06090, partial [Chitinophagaceae bacterium]
IRRIQRFDPDQLDYDDYMKKRREEEKSTTKKKYFKDILFSYREEIRLRLFEFFIKPFEISNEKEIEDIRTILSGGKIDINIDVFEKGSQLKGLNPSNTPSPESTEATPSEIPTSSLKNQTKLPIVVILTAINDEYVAVQRHLIELEEVEKNDTHYEKGIFCVRPGSSPS